MKWAKVALIAVLVMVMQFASCFVGPASALEPPAQVTIDGQGFYYSTGEAYPVSIEVRGYNSRTRRLYLDYELKTEYGVTAPLAAEFFYEIVIYDKEGQKIAVKSSADASPEARISAAGVNFLSAKNQDLGLSANYSLPAYYSLVFTIKEVKIQ